MKSFLLLSAIEHVQFKPFIIDGIIYFFIFSLCKLIFSHFFKLIPKIFTKKSFSVEEQIS